MIALGTHSKIAIGWTAITVTGVTAFILSKRSIDQKRKDNMKIRERMRKANEGEYSPSSRNFE